MTSRSLNASASTTTGFEAVPDQNDLRNQLIYKLNECKFAKLGQFNHVCNLELSYLETFIHLGHCYRHIHLSVDLIVLITYKTINLMRNILQLFIFHIVSIFS
ncbi:hypothetical protein V8G54_029521 [Vigna mungo]|uniref:Uncharacterized protein n=1 Tax=Vigna mungo TaxID=3915 RepID=A0AAQ3MUC7_VIGMU